MKNLPKPSVVLLAVAGACLIALPAKAAVDITEVANPTDTTTFYGSADDFILFNASTGSDTSVLTDFTANPYGNPRDNPDNTTIVDPAGNSDSSGVVWQFGGPGATVVLTLGDSSTFDYSDFYMTILYNNISGSTTEYNDTDILLLANGYPNTSNAYSVANVTTGLDAGDVVEFHITGATAGEYFGLSALSANADDGNMIGLGGISISQTQITVPEPGTWAMLGAGLAAMVFFVRRRGLKA